MKKLLKATRFFLLEQKFRFDTAMSLLSIVNYTLLIIAVSDKIQKVLPFNTGYIIIICVPTMFFVIWFAGYILEKFIRFPQEFEATRIKRSPAWSSVYEMHGKIDKILDKLNED